MPETITIAAFVFGAVLILLSLVSGGFKIFGAEVSGTVGRLGRIVAFVLGLILITFGLSREFLPERKTATTPEENKSTPAEAAVRARNTSSYAGWDPAIGKHTWNWTIFIETDPRTLSQVECVEYTLHHTYLNPMRRVCTSANSFALTERAWGTFPVQIKVIFKNGSARYLTHMLTFRQPERK